MTWRVGARAERRSSWKIRSAAVLAGMWVGGLWLPAAAAADTCPLELFVECTSTGTSEPRREPREVLAAGAPDAKIAGGVEHGGGEPAMAPAGQAEVDLRWPAGLILVGVTGALVLMAQRRWRRGPWTSSPPSLSRSSPAIG